MPIKLKLKNPEKAKDLENDRWLADLEIEVKNTGTKPIYFLDFCVEFVDVKRDSGANIGYLLPVRQESSWSMSTRVGDGRRTCR